MNWKTRESDAHQLEEALKAFAIYEQKKEEDDAKKWAKNRCRDLEKYAHIDSIAKLSVACRIGKDNVNENLPDGHRLSKDTFDGLLKFLPGPDQAECLRVAKRAVHRVIREEEKGTKMDTVTVYRHGPKKGFVGKQKFDVDGEMFVDCSGFVRFVQSTALNEEIKSKKITLQISDRDYMRAKDYFDYFSKMNKTEPGAGYDWRQICDIRMVVPGDVLVYRVKGCAAGGAEYVKVKDETSEEGLKELLIRVKTSELYDEDDADDSEDDGDERVVHNETNYRRKAESFDKEISEKLEKLKNLKIDNLQKLRAKMKDRKLSKELKDVLLLEEDRIEEALNSNQSNTGHVVFVAGPAESVKGQQWRIPVYQSTGYGHKIKDPKSGKVMGRHKGVERNTKSFWKQNDGTWVKKGGGDTRGCSEVIAGRLMS